MFVTKEKNSPALSVHKENKPQPVKGNSLYSVLKSLFFLDPFDKNGHSSTFSPQRIIESESTSQCLAYICYCSEASAHIFKVGSLHYR